MFKYLESLNNPEKILLLEDDCKFKKNFINDFKNIVDNLSKN